MLKEDETNHSAQVDSHQSNHQLCNRLIVAACQDCNLRCKYCYAQQGSYGQYTKDKYMKIETYKKSFEFILTEFPQGVQCIQFFGGEPLLNVEFIKEACRWTLAYCQERNIQLPGFTIVTNGTICSDDIVQLFNEYSFAVTISIDGNKEVNDINRIYKGSNHSVFDMIEKNVSFMNNQNRRFRLSFEVTVDKANIEQFKRNQVLIDIEKILSLNPDALHIIPAQWADEKQEDSDYEQDFVEYFDALSNMLFEKTIRNETQLTSIIGFLNKVKNKTLKKNVCGAGIKDFSINVDGDIYPCFVFIGIEKFRMGNVHTYEASNNYKQLNDLFIRTTFDDMEECRECWASGLCHCCLGFNYLSTGSLTRPSKSMCISQKTLLKRTIFNCSDVFK